MKQPTAWPKAAVVHKRRVTKRGHGGFSLIELLVTLAIIGLVAAVVLPALSRSKLSAQGANCESNLRELALATDVYLGDNQDQLFNRCAAATTSGQQWWFGWLQGTLVPEGQRAYDLTSGKLYPYINAETVRLCPSPVWSSPQFKLKGTNVIYSYGCNAYLFAAPAQIPISINKVVNPSDNLYYADSAQVNTFQAPASPTHPMFEEFYYEDLETNYSNVNNEPNAQFRHSQKANAVFADGHVGLEAAVSGSYDKQLPGQYIGQLPPEILNLH